MAVERWILLDKLKRAVKKIKFLLNFNVNRWKLASIIGASSSKRRLSFNDRPGLRACVEDSGSDEDPGSSRGLQRTISYPSEDDIDKRADAFIANFYKQLQFERQISLELRPGLRACVEDSGSDEDPGSSRELQRTISYPSEDDNDKMHL